MKQWIHAGCAVATLLATPLAAHAADIAAKSYTKAPPMEQVHNWTGWYAGINAGYGFGNSTNVAGPND